MKSMFKKQVENTTDYCEVTVTYRFSAGFVRGMMKNWRDVAVQLPEVVAKVMKAVEEMDK